MAGVFLGMAVTCAVLAVGMYAYTVTRPDSYAFAIFAGGLAVLSWVLW